MKKFLLTCSTILAFAGYIIYQRTSGPEQQLVTVPQTNQPSTSYPTTPAPTTNGNQSASGSYKDGSYTGDLTDAYYGNVQVQATISGGKITDVQFLDYPQDRQHSIAVNSQAMPMLKTEAIQAQSANVDTISGATMTSEAFVKSLQSALDKAKS